MHWWSSSVWVGCTGAWQPWIWWGHWIRWTENRFWNLFVSVNMTVGVSVPVLDMIPTSCTHSALYRLVPCGLIAVGVWGRAAFFFFKNTTAGFFNWSLNVFTCIFNVFGVTESGSTVLSLSQVLLYSYSPPAMFSPPRSWCCMILWALLTWKQWWGISGDCSRMTAALLVIDGERWTHGSPFVLWLALLCWYVYHSFNVKCFTYHDIPDYTPYSNAQDNPTNMGMVTVWSTAWSF